MTKADEIKTVEKIKDLIFKLINTKDGYVKDFLKEMGSLETIKGDFDQICHNIKSDFPAFLLTNIKKKVDLDRKRRAILHQTIRAMESTLDSQVQTIKELIGVSEHQESLIVEIMKVMLMCRYYDPNTSFDETSKKIEDIFIKHRHENLIIAKIDMGIELLPEEKEIVKTLLKR